MGDKDALQARRDGAFKEIRPGNTHGSDCDYKIRGIASGGGTIRNGYRFADSERVDVTAMHMLMERVDGAPKYDHVLVLNHHNNDEVIRRIDR